MTNQHISEELPSLLTGDASRDVVMAAAEHLRNCPDCQQELVAAVVAHASLSSAHRFAPEIVSTGAGQHAAPADDGAALPDLGDLFTQAKQDADHAAARAARRPRRTVLLAAAAAVVVAGGGTATGLALTSSSAPSTRQVALAAYGTGDNPASATLAGTRLKVNATSLPAPSAGHRYEVWLTDPTRKSMQSVGYIGDGNTANLDVPGNVISHYSDIEVSVQRVGQTKYSGVSVLRGEYN